MTKQMMVLIALFVYVFVRSVFIEPNSLVVNKYEIENRSLQDIRIVYLTDFHLAKRDYKRLDKIITLTNRQNPDLVFLGGDYPKGNNLKSSMDMSLFAQKMSLISAPKYAVLGNTDWIAGGSEISDALKHGDIYLLRNSAVRTIIKRRYVDIIGVDDLQTMEPNIEKALKGTRRPRIFLTHNPDIYYDIMEDVDLILAGHTHGGQFVLPFTPPLFVPSKFGAEFASGLISSTHNKMIISKGLGTSILPVRLNCKPEIVVVDFVSSR